MNLGCDISKGGRDQLLIDLVKVHYFEFSSIARLDEMLLFGGGDRGSSPSFDWLWKLYLVQGFVPSDAFH